MKVGGRNQFNADDSVIKRGRFPTIALSAHWHTFPDRFAWILKNGFALEYSPNPGAFESLPIHVDPMLQTGIPVRHHGFFPGHEIGNVDEDAAELALHVHIAALESLRGRGEQVITFHMGLKRDISLDAGRTVDNLARLVQHATDQGVIVCLENLRQGPTSNPETVVE